MKKYVFVLLPLIGVLGFFYITRCAAWGWGAVSFEKTGVAPVKFLITIPGDTIPFVGFKGNKDCNITILYFFKGDLIEKSTIKIKKTSLL